MQKSKPIFCDHSYESSVSDLFDSIDKPFIDYFFLLSSTELFISDGEFDDLSSELDFIIKN